VEPYAEILSYQQGQASSVIKLVKNGIPRYFSTPFTYKMTASRRYPLSIIAGTIFEHSHDLLFGAASVAGKVDNAYRLVGGSPVNLTDGALPNIERNPTCWAHGWDISGIPVWNSSGGTGGGPKHGGALITSQHLWEAKHYPSPVGTQFKFLKNDGSGVETRTSVGVYEKPSAFTSFDEEQISTGTNKLGVPTPTQVAIAKAGVLNDFFGDVRIHVLDSPLPATVSPFPIVAGWISPEAGPLPEAQSTERAWAEGSTPIYVQGANNIKRDILPPLLFLNQNRVAKFLGTYATESIISQPSFDAIGFDGLEITTGPLYAEFYQAPTFNLADERSDFFNGIMANSFASTGAIPNDSGSGLFFPIDASNLALVALFLSSTTGPLADATRLNLMVSRADIAAGITTGTATVPGGAGTLTVTVAPDPTL
jgi:hypothetical protein